MSRAVSMMLQQCSIHMACRQFNSRPYTGESNKLWPVLLKEGMITAKAREVPQAISALLNLPVLHH